MDLVIGTTCSERSLEVEDTLRVERIAFAAKLRAARAVLGLSQSEFAQEIGLTQKSIHRIEQGAVQPKHRTILKIERFWYDRNLSIEDLRDGGFRLIVNSSALMRD